MEYIATYNLQRIVKWESLGFIIIIIYCWNYVVIKLYDCFTSGWDHFYFLVLNHINNIASVVLFIFLSYIKWKSFLVFYLSNNLQSITTSKVSNIIKSIIYFGKLHMITYFKTNDLKCFELTTEIITIKYSFIIMYILV